MSVSASDAAVQLTREAIRAAIARFADEFADAESEHAESQTFWNTFFSCFGINRRAVAVFEHTAKRHSKGGDGWIDLLWPGNLGVEQKSAGKSLDEAMDQLLDYLPDLPHQAMPRFLVACDFQTWLVRDLETDTEVRFALSELVDHLDLFWWIAGYAKPDGPIADDEIAANLEATDLLAAVHDAILASGYDPSPLREWMTRILFCLFADDAGIWDRHTFHHYLLAHTSADGHDLGTAIQQIFKVLDTPPENRPGGLDEDLAALTYVNGDLFENDLWAINGSREIRDALLSACEFDWSVISPTIFGSLFQNVMQPAERRQLGAHYTTEQNILRTIKPLFLDDLEEELEAAGANKNALERFHDKLACLTFFDPACGCGNFLVVAYREIRRLETETLRRLSARRGTTGQRVASLDLLCRVHVDQFYGIEIEEFPARIARTALYLADHIANRDVSAEFGEHYLRFPIPASPHIHIDNALRTDWNKILPADEADYVFGNPPFVGMSWLDDNQRDDNRIVFSELPNAGSRTGRLDYVACWYSKALDYGKDRRVRFAFVSTNSITQGDQARALGPLVGRFGFKIVFAHRTFAWASEARGRAHVHVVIIGFAHQPAAKAGRLFDYPDLNGEPTEIAAKNINWYLTDAPDIYPAKRTDPWISGLPVASKGSQPTDGKHLLVTADQYNEVAADPIAKKYLRPYRQSKEFLHGIDRWCLWLVDAPPQDLRNSPILRQRLAEVTASRKASKTASVREQAATPSLFTQIRQPSCAYLAFPEVSSSRRRIVPAAYLDSDVIAGNKLIVLPDAPLWLFGILQSRMWDAWLRGIGGYLKSDPSFSPDLTYCTFPFPEFTDRQCVRIEAAAQEVLDARAAQPDASLADLYDPIATPADLLAAHRALDRAVDASITRKKIETDGDRLAVLLDRYQALASAAESPT